MYARVKSTLVATWDGEKMSEADLLKELQTVDLEILRINKKLRDIPEHEALAKVVKTLEEIEEKSKQISALRSNCEVEMQKLSDEDVQLAKRSKDLQAEIGVTADFRMVDRLNRDLEGIGKRRNKIEFEHDKLVERSEKISTLEDQVQSVRQKHEADEKKLRNKIAESEESVRAEMEKLDSKHKKIASKLSSELLDLYDKTAASKGGIAVGVLQDNHCSACRIEFPEGKLTHLNAGPEITKCPQCHRILIVQKA